MFRRNLQRGRFQLGIFSLLLIGLIHVAGCGGSQEESPTELSSTSPPPALEAEQPREEEMEQPDSSPPSAAEEMLDEARKPAFPSPRGSVLAHKELGMVVSGKGVTDPHRSLDALEEQILLLLPELREVYEREREQDPGLMGSLDVHMTIESQGTISDLRFPTRRVSSEKLVTAAFDRMRAWTFPPADEQVQLRYTLLFVPPGIDQSSIVLWERQLGTRMVRAERIETNRHEGKPTEVATTAAPKPAKKPMAKAPPRTERAETERQFVVGWYQVIRPTSLHAAPREAAEVVSRLRSGTRVRVVDLAAGEWLEIHSVTNRPPGFLHREDAVPESAEEAERLGESPQP
ncbi:MAG: AgmX/PglI C-terminal domain-containing protein [Candidatus Binatia bacterium]